MSGKSELKINQKFAERYEKYRQKEELQRYEEEESDDEEAAKRRERAALPSYIQEQKAIKESFRKFVEDSEEDDEKDEGFQLLTRRTKTQEEKRAALPSYIQEQKAIKESFRKFVEDSEEDDEKDEGFQLLTRRTKTQEEKDREEEDYLNWLKGQKDLEGKEDLQDLRYLHDYWNDPSLDDGEKFLRDYMLNKGYLEGGEEEHRFCISALYRPPQCGDETPIA
ncbi:UNVERIFIED_CONTAM: hypothetical protein FKN15_055361 [Acipenser sinensis]